MTKPEFKLGDRVAFRAAFCRSIMDFTDHPHRRGTVIALRGDVVRVMWDGAAGKSTAALAVNLIHVDHIHREVV